MSRSGYVGQDEALEQARPAVDENEEQELQRRRDDGRRESIDMPMATMMTLTTKSITRKGR